MTTNEAFFSEHNPLVWSGEEGTIEEWAYSDGVIAVAIGLAVILASVVSGGAIAIAFELGRILR